MTRIIKCMFLFGLLMVARVAWADYAAVPVWTCGGSGATANKDSQAACDAFSKTQYSNAGAQGAYGVVQGLNWPTSNNFQCRSYTAANYNFTNNQCVGTPTCPSGGTLTSGNGTYTCKGVDLCTAGKVETIWASVAVTASNKDTVVPAFPQTDGKCGVTTQSMKECVTLLQSGYKDCAFTVVQTGLPFDTDPNWQISTDGPTGATNNADTSPPVKSPTGTCPAGTVKTGSYGTGEAICFGQGTAPNQSATASTTTLPTTTTTNADGSTTTVATSKVTNTDGSVTTITTTTVKGTDGTSTVKVDRATGPTPAGTPGKDGSAGRDGAAGTPGKDAKGLCESNPTLTVCKNSTVANACSAGASSVTCTGDAIQCETLRQAAAMRCQQQKDADDLTQATEADTAKSVAAGSDPEGASLPSMQNASTVSMPSNLDTAGWLGAGANFADVSFTVQGHTITVPVSKWASYLIALRYALMVVASLVSFRMLSGVILRD